MKTLEQINKERESLKKKLFQLDRLEAFKQQCSFVALNDELANSITTLINAHEEKEFICTTITKSFERKPYYEPTGHYDNDPSGCGGGWITTGEKLVFPPDEILSVIVVMEKELYDLFMSLTFSNSQDFLTNLKKLASNGKHMVTSKNIFTKTSFPREFQYVNDFINLIAETRYESNNMNVNLTILLNKMLAKQTDKSKSIQPKKQK